MVEENGYKYQLSIKAGGQMFNYRATSSEDFRLILGIAGELNADSVADYLAKLNNKVERVETKVVKEAPAPVAGCSHKNTKPMSGTGKKGPWQGLKCLDCGAANFKNRSKDGGSFWGGWQPKKGSAELPSRTIDELDQDLPF